MKKRKVQKDTKVWLNAMAKVRRMHPKWGLDRRKQAAYKIRTDERY